MTWFNETIAWLGPDGMGLVQGAITTGLLQAWRRVSGDALWERWGTWARFAAVALAASTVATAGGLAQGQHGGDLAKAVLSSAVAAVGLRQLIKNAAARQPPPGELPRLSL
jgi:hypothetical protein